MMKRSLTHLKEAERLSLIVLRKVEGLYQELEKVNGNKASTRGLAAGVVGEVRELREMLGRDLTAARKARKARNENV